MAHVTSACMPADVVHFGRFYRRMTAIRTASSSWVCQLRLRSSPTFAWYTALVGLGMPRIYVLTILKLSHLWYVLVRLFNMANRCAKRGQKDETVSSGSDAGRRGFVRSAAGQTFAWLKMGWEGERREGCPRNRNGSTDCQLTFADY